MTELHKIHQTQDDGVGGDFGKKGKILQSGYKICGQERLTVEKIAIHPYQNDGSKIKLTEETITLFYFSIYFHLV